jgi:hypothetical protein
MPGATKALPKFSEELRRDGEVRISVLFVRFYHIFGQKGRR